MLFFMLVRLTGNLEHIPAFETITERLEPAQRSEAALLGADLPELLERLYRL